MTTPMLPDEMKRELRAVLDAHREMGTEYDEYFIETFIERLVRQMAPARPASARQPTAGQRVAVAITSLVVLAPFSLLLLVMAGVIAHELPVLAIGALLLGLGMICGAIAVVNVAVNKVR